MNDDLRHIDDRVDARLDEMHGLLMRAYQAMNSAHRVLGLDPSYPQELVDSYEEIGDFLYPEVVEAELRFRPGVPEDLWWCEPCEMKGLKSPAVVVRTEAADTPVCDWHDKNEYLWGHAPPFHRA